jgi:hypothetical protein
MHHNFKKDDSQTIYITFKGIVDYPAFGLTFFLIRRKIATGSTESLSHDNAVVFLLFIYFEAKHLDFFRASEVTEEIIISLSKYVSQLNVSVRILKGMNLKKVLNQLTKDRFDHFWLEKAFL